MSAVRRARRRRLARARWTSSARKAFLLQLARRLGFEAGSDDVVVRICRREIEGRGQPDWRYRR